MQKRQRDVMVSFPFILPGHLLLGVVGFCDMTALLPRHERGERWDSRAAPPSTLVLHRSWFISPPLNLTEDLTDKMLVHVNKNYIVGFVFEHSFEWYNFRWHASAFIVLYIMLVQFLVVLLHSSKLGHSSRYCREYQYYDHSSKLSGIDMTLHCWYVSRKSSGVM